VEKDTLEKRITLLSKTLKPRKQTPIVSIAEQFKPLFDELKAILVNQKEPIVNVSSIPSKEPTINFNPEINVPQIKIPNIKIPKVTPNIQVNVPEQKEPVINVTIPEQKLAKEWDFTIHRLENGLISSITAKRIA